MKIKVEFDLELDGIEEMSDEEKFYAIEEIIQNGAESNNAYVNVKTIEYKNE